MEDLLVRAKKLLIDSLTNNEQNLNEPYLNRGGINYTRKMIADEIQNETDFGVKLISDSIYLMIDVLTRK